MGTTESAFYSNESNDAGDADEEEKKDVYTAHQSPHQRPAVIDAVAQLVPRPPSKAPVIPSITLTGVIMGLKGSGKRTLLSRLQGKDPFSTSESQPLSSVEAPAEPVMLPYQAPPQQPTWERIRLQVTLSAKAPSTLVDFAVILINPQQDRSVVKSYLGNRIRSLLRRHGYGDSGRRSMLPGQRKAVCICLLLNFRDVIQRATGRKASSFVTESDVREDTLEVLQSYEDLEPSHLVLQCGYTSLYNCYGLGLLHHFIYQSYLQRRQFDLQRMVEEVQKAQLVARQQNVIVPYENFLELLNGHGSKVKRSTKSQVSSQRANVPSSGESSGSPGRRAVVQSWMSPVEEVRPAIPKKDGNSKAALEAFLEEDDDDDYMGEDVQTRKERVLDDGENVHLAADDDDEFFYDESGRRSGTRSTSRKTGAFSPNRKDLQGSRKPKQASSDGDNVDASQQTIMQETRNQSPPTANLSSMSKKSARIDLQDKIDEESGEAGQSNSREATSVDDNGGTTVTEEVAATTSQDSIKAVVTSKPRDDHKAKRPTLPTQSQLIERTDDDEEEFFIENSQQMESNREANQAMHSQDHEDGVAQNRSLSVESGDAEKPSVEVTSALPAANEAGRPESTSNRPTSLSDAAVAAIAVAQAEALKMLTEQEEEQTKVKKSKKLKKKAKDGTVKKSKVKKTVPAEVSDQRHDHHVEEPK